MYVCVCGIHVCACMCECGVHVCMRVCACAGVRARARVRAVQHDRRKEAKCVFTSIFEAYDFE